MTRFLCFLVFLSICCRAEEPRPVLVVLEEDPWLSVIGSDSPTFALYDDGTILALREKPTIEEPFQSRTVADATKKADSLLTFDQEKMKSRYELSAATDQITTVIWTPKKKIEIYGSWRERPKKSGASDPKWKSIEEREKKMREALPKEIREALLRIDQERQVKGASWFPPKIEVMFWPYEYAPDESIHWPKDWPGLGARDTQKRGADAFSVFLPSEKWPELRKFLATQKEKGAVLIDGKKMATSYRFPFPGETAWMRSSKKAE